MAVKITDTTLRDAHQSLIATRLRGADILPIAGELDGVGFFSLESWGGATFDVCIRFLNEDPWERLRTFKAHLPKTPLQMLLRGQNLVGYRHYPDDVVVEFIRLAIKNGVGIFRIFDALNDVRNMTTAIPFLKAVVENPSFLKGEMTTHFIEEERELFQDMVRIIEKEKSLQEKLEIIFNPRRKMAAIAMALEAYREQA